MKLKFRFAAWRHRSENPGAVVGKKADMSVYRIGVKYEFWRTDGSTNNEFELTCIWTPWHHVGHLPVLD
jgi:hypothetical protein